MFSNEDRIDLILDLTNAAKAQDARKISRLADHGLDMGIITESTHRKFIVLGGVIFQSTHADGEFYANIITDLARNL